MIFRKLSPAIIRSALRLGLNRGKRPMNPVQSRGPARRREQTADRFRGAAVPETIASRILTQVDRKTPIDHDRMLYR